MRKTYPRDVPDEDHVAEIMERTAVTEAEAWEILARERGEIGGDVIGVEFEPVD